MEERAGKEVGEGGDVESLEEAEGEFLVVSF